MIDLLQDVETLVHPLAARARRTPGAVALVFIDENGRTEIVTAGEFHRRVVAYAQALRSLGVGHGDLVVLVLQHSQALLAAFWGAIYLGAVPSIFPFLTEKLDPAVYAQQVRALIEREGARAAITYAAFEGELRRLVQDAACAVLCVDAVAAHLPEETEPALATPAAAESIAFLQHSSGTTGLHKGVALTHGAVLNQLRAYARAISLRPDDVVASWLPLYHDMGLIAGFVLPLVAGIPLVLLSPFHWVRDPKSLLWAVHTHGATLSWLPNFALNHTVRSVRPRDLAGLNLQRWRMVINCSEPLHHSSHAAFLRHLSPYGLRPSALATCYAMAENTFAVTQSTPQTPPPVDWVDRRRLQDGLAVAAAPGAEGAHPLVSCGQPLVGVEITIVDAERRPLAERTIGEIVIRSDSMLREYYKQPELTAAAFWEGWYCTGDLGYLADDQLFVTGRKKDLVIVGGKNIYPQDLEAIAGTIGGIHPGRVVAFGVPDERLGTEALVVVGELSEETEGAAVEQIEREVRRRAVQELDVTLADVRLVAERWLIKTSSGKIARAANREKYLRTWRQEVEVP